MGSSKASFLISIAFSCSALPCDLFLVFLHLCVVLPSLRVPLESVTLDFRTLSVRPLHSAAQTVQCSVSSCWDSRTTLPLRTRSCWGFTPKRSCRRGWRCRRRTGDRSVIMYKSRNILSQDVSSTITNSGWHFMVGRTG